jgi:hypothetical protein
MLDPRNSIEMAIRLILRVLNKDPSQHMSAKTIAACIYGFL